MHAVVDLRPWGKPSAVVQLYAATPFTNFMGSYSIIESGDCRDYQSGNFPS